MWSLLRYLWLVFLYSMSSWIYISIIKLNYKVDFVRDWVFDDSGQTDNVYDYIIVGAGTAGCTLAARLSENAANKILVIEAGGRPSFLHDLPIAAPMLQQTPYDWQFVTEPQKNACFGLTGKRSLWPRGKILGGTSRLNYLMYLRGHLSDYDSWQSPDGHHWNPAEILAYFKLSEKQIGRYASDKEFHSSRGPVYVSDLRYRSSLVDALLQSAEELGLGIGDLNGAAGTGFMETQTMTRDGARYSADHLLLGRPNVKVLLHTHVTKVLLRNSSEAYGVRCKRHSRYLTMRARKDVILTAGTIGSPQILMLSGIGPAAHLRKNRIKVAVDLPVGDNLQDHVSTGMDLVVTNQSSPLSWYTVVNPLNPLLYLLYGTGPLTHPGCEVVALVHSQNNSTGIPDLQYMALPGGLSSDAGVVLKRVMGIPDKLFRDYFAPLVGTPVLTLLTTLLHPLSHGTIRLQSRNPLQPPLIDPRYLSHPEDTETLVRGLELLSKLVTTGSMARAGSYIYPKPLPPCAHHPFQSHAYWICYVRHLTVTAYHPVGTCRMGSAADPTTVVDHTLRVHGISRLVVADASVMPTMPSANINAAVMMIAEKAADLITDYWYTRHSSCRALDILLHPKPLMCVPS